MTQGAASGLWVALGQALTGERLDPPPHQPADAPALTAWLAAHGWSSARLVALRQECQRKGRPWPFVPDQSTREGIGAAQLHSMLTQVRRLTGTDGLRPTVHTGPRPLGPDERRLLAERPPHHGNG